jgi:cytochrome c553
MGQGGETMARRLAILAIVGLGGLLVGGAAQAATPPAKTAICASCHGKDGRSPYPTFPNIAGQNFGYIAYALGQYQQHQRLGSQADTMSGIAAQLTPDDIKALASYYASLTP